MVFLKTNIDELPRKEREKRFRRSEILSAAVPLFAEKGYENTTIDDIAEKAEFGKGTIYNYFGSKEDIYWGILEEIFQSYYESLQEIDKQNAKFYDFMMELTYRLFEFCVNNRYSFIMVTRHRTNVTQQSSKPPKTLIDYQKNVDAILKKRIERAIKANEINKIDISSFITLYRSMVFPYIYNQMFCNKTDKFDLKCESRLLVDILFNGIKKS